VFRKINNDANGLMMGDLVEPSSHSKKMGAIEGIQVHHGSREIFSVSIPNVGDILIDV